MTWKSIWAKTWVRVLACVLLSLPMAAIIVIWPPTWIPLLIWGFLSQDRFRVRCDGCAGTGYIFVGGVVDTEGAGDVEPCWKCDRVHHTGHDARKRATFRGCGFVYGSLWKRLRRGGPRTVFVHMKGRFMDLGG